MPTKKEIDKLLLNVKPIHDQVTRYEILNGQDSHNNTTIMLLALEPRTERPEDIARSTQKLVDANVDLGLRNDAGLNVLDIAALQREEMLPVLISKIASLSQNEQRDLYKEFHLSDEAMEYCFVLNEYIARQSGKIMKKDAEEIDINKAFLGVGGVQALISNHTEVPEEKRIQQMRAILLAGKGSLMGHKFLGGFFGKPTVGEDLLYAVGAKKAPGAANDGTELGNIQRSAVYLSDDSVASDDEDSDEEDAYYKHK